MRKCKTCGMPLWFAWLTMSWPWKKRVRKFKEAQDCIHTLSMDTMLNVQEYLDKMEAENGKSRIDSTA